MLEEAERLNYIIGKAKETATLFGYKEVITPVVEPLELLAAKAGEEIRQRMFIFEDMGGRRVALRPEFTASIARLATTVLRNEPKPLRTLSVGSVYRYDEPQKGRYREFWQADFEVIGSSKPEADAEVILLANNLLKSVGLKGYALKLGHVGVLRNLLTQEGVDEKTQNAVLQRMDKKEYDVAFALVASEKCQTVLRGLLELKGNNAFETIQNLCCYVKPYPKALEAAEYLASVVKLVVESGCPIESVDPAFARGLEYYTGVIFEMYVPELGLALGGGGRYDKLIELFGGEPTPATGMAAGLDRIVIATEAQETKLQKQASKRTALVPIKEELRGEALKIAQMLRDAGVPVEFEVMGRKMAKALEDADKRKMDYVIIVGERELREGKVVVKDLAKRTQVEVEILGLAEKIRG